MDNLRAILVDTSAWLALMNRNDRMHAAAVAFHRSLGPGVRRVTTWGIVAETYTWLRYHVSHAAAQRWLHEQAALNHRGELEVVFPTPMSEAGVQNVLSRFEDQDLSYVDGLSLSLLQTRDDLELLFAFDQYLALSGAAVLPRPLP